MKQVDEIYDYKYALQNAYKHLDECTIYNITMISSEDSLSIFPV